MTTATASRLFPRIVQQTGQKCSSVVLFLHGSGDTGDGVSEWVRMASRGEFSFPHTKILFPTAPIRPYTPMGGGLSHVWFDRQQISPNVPEHAEGIESMCAVLSDLIRQEVDSGIPKSRIVIGGFSMGGAMALHLAYRYHRDVAGVFALSAFLNKGSAVYKELECRPADSPVPPLYYCHGDRDELALPVWGKETFDNLFSLGIPGTFQTYPIYHELNRKELASLKSWINWRIPER